jgi:uncharacterized membrane protein YuzA (DUF378 family)
MALDQPILSERRKLTDRRVATGSNILRAADWLAMTVLIIGGINWALVGLLDIDLIAMVFGEMTGAARASYVAVGIASLYAIYMMTRLSSDPQK